MTVSAQHLFWLVPLAFTLGFMACDFWREAKKYDEELRDLEGSYQRAMEKLKAMESEQTHADCHGIDDEDEGEFWKGFCQTCRGFHGQGKCPGKWRVL